MLKNNEWDKLTAITANNPPIIPMFDLAAAKWKSMGFEIYIEN